MWPLPLHSRKFNFNCPSKPVAYKKRHQNCTKVYMKTESYILLILSCKIARFSSSCHLQGDLANSLTDEFKKKITVIIMVSALVDPQHFEHAMT